MSKVIVIYHYDPQRESDRATLRPEHLAYLGNLEKSGKLQFAGAWINESEHPGALLLLNVSTFEEALNYLKHDPNQVHGIVQRIETHFWEPAVGSAN